MEWSRSWQSAGTDWVLAIVATALGGWLRWSGLGRQSLWVDEMSSFGMADTGLRQIIPTVLSFDGHPPLYIFLVHIAHFNFGLGTVDSLRVPSLIAGTLTIPVVYFLARYLVGRLAAIVATTLIVLSPLIVWYSREGRMYAVTWLFVMLSFVALVQAVRSGRLAWLGAYAVCVALSLYADISAVMAIVPQAAIVAWFFLRTKGAERRMWLRAGLSYVAGWLLFVPWLAVLPRQLPLLHGTFSGYEPSPASALRLALNLVGLDATYGSIYAPVMPWVVVVLVLLGYAATIAIAVARRRDHPPFTAVAIALTAGPAAMCLALVVAGSPGVLLPRVMGLAAFGLALTVGGAAELVWRPLEAIRLSRAAVAALVAVILGATSLSLVNVEAHGYNGQDWRSAARLISNHAQPGDALIYYPYGLKIMVDAYLPVNSPWIKDGVGLWGAPHAVAEQEFAQWAAGHPRVWVVFYAADAIDMPVHDQWFRDYGYTRVLGNPDAGDGVLEYVPNSSS
jgi:4-amino-4-deoxy-L-arabinose transferase-like glycosyltransferase